MLSVMSVASHKLDAKGGSGFLPMRLFLFANIVFGLAFYAVHLQASQTRADNARSATSPTWDRPYTPNQQAPITSETSNHKLLLKHKNPCPTCPAGHSFTFEIKEKQSGRAWKFTVANGTAQVDEAHIVNGTRAVVVGRASPHLSLVTIVLIPTGVVLDSFFCFRPAISPDSSTVAYVKFYPEHIGHGYYTTDEYLVYDLRASPADNRLGASKKDASDPYNVGVPIYPEGSQNKVNDNVTVDATLTHSMSSDGFFWLDKNNSFAFADQFLGAQRLVVVDLKGGIRSAKLTLKALQDLAIVDTEKCKDLSPNAFQVADVEPIPGKPATLRLFLRSSNPGCLAHSTLEIKTE